MKTADYQQAKFESLGDRIAQLRAKGVCSHGWLKTTPGQQQTTCLDCGAIFNSFQQAMQAGREILKGDLT